MPKPLTLEQIQQLQQIVQQGDVQTVIEVYKGLQAQGYEYSGWARGVAAADSITGMAAMDYMTSTAMIGVNGNDGVNLSQAQQDKVRMDMSMAPHGNASGAERTWGVFSSAARFNEGRLDRRPISAYPTHFPLSPPLGGNGAPGNSTA